MGIDWPIVGMAIPLLLRGALVTLWISAFAIVLGTAGGVLFGLLSLSPSRLGQRLVAAYVGFVRGTPLLIQIFLIFRAAQPRHPAE